MDESRVLRREDLLRAAAACPESERVLAPAEPTPVRAARPRPRSRAERILGPSTVRLMNWANQLAQRVNVAVDAAERRRREDDAEASRAATRVIPLEDDIVATLVTARRQQRPPPRPPIADVILRHGPPVRVCIPPTREAAAA